MFLFFSPSALGDFHGLVFLKRAGGCGGGRAVLFIAARAAPALSELPLSSRPAAPPARPGWSAASSAAAGRSRHVVRGEKEPPHPARLHSSTAPHKALGKGGGREKGEKGKKKKKTHPKPTISLQRPRRGAPGGSGGEPAAPPPSAEENAAPNGRRSHDGGCPHTTRSATGSAVPTAGRPSRRPGHGAAAAFHIINPPEFSGEAISWAGWRH